MKIIELILKGVKQVEDIVKIAKAVIAGLDAFTESLKEQSVVQVVESDKTE